MVLFACVDDRNGMLFGGRRQSKDRVVRARILEVCGDNTLWMSSYSASQFESDKRIVADDAYAAQVGVNDACFIEDGDWPATDASTIVLYHWNRCYPADKHFPFDPLHYGYTLVSSIDFEGFSHETITEKRYEKEVIA